MIEIIYNLDTYDFKVNFNQTKAKTAIFFGFENNLNDDTLYFNNLSFGFTVVKDAEIIVQKSFPKSGTKFKQTNEKYLASSSVVLPYGKNILLGMWVDENNNLQQNTVVYKTILPTKPFDSWIWNSKDEEYVAPKSKPDDDNYYVWNEDLKQWIEDYQIDE